VAVTVNIEAPAEASSLAHIIRRVGKVPDKEIVDPTHMAVPAIRVLLPIECDH
jgi:hypothetical protein